MIAEKEETYTSLQNHLRNRLFTKSEVQKMRGNKKKMFKNRANFDIRKHSFSMRIVNNWNSLPNKVVNAKTLNEFKSRHWENEKYYHCQ